MPSVRSVLRHVHTFLCRHYAHISFVALCTLIITAFLHFELQQNNRDLIYWKDLLQHSYQEMEHFAVLAILIVLMLKIAFIALVISMNSRSLSWYDELSQLEIKKRYADFLFLRLITDLDKIESKYLSSNNTSDIIALKSFIMAHDDMTKTIGCFRKDARKLFTPNEMEVSLPIQDVYGLVVDEEVSLKKSRFYKKNIKSDDELIKNILNP